MVERMVHQLSVYPRGAVCHCHRATIELAAAGPVNVVRLYTHHLRPGAGFDHLYLLASLESYYSFYRYDIRMRRAQDGLMWWLDGFRMASA